MPHRIKIALVTLTAVIGCVWFIGSVDEPGPVDSAVPATDIPGSVLREHGSFEEREPDTQDDAPVAAQLTMVSARDQLAGRIVDADGRGLAGIKVSLRTMRRANRGFFLRQAETGADGDFVLEEIDPNGVYMLFTEAISGYPAYRIEGFTPDSLPEPFEIQLSRLQLIDIEGTIVDVEHTPVANFTFTVDSLNSNYPARVVTSDASGFFRIDAFPVGRLKFYTAAPEYFRVLGLQALGDRYDNLSLVIDQGNYRLSGHVFGRDGRPIPSTRVTLNSSIAGKEYQSVAFRTRHTDEAGYFEFTQLGGIAHSLGVYATGYKPLIRNHEFQSFSDQLEFRLHQ